MCNSYILWEHIRKESLMRTFMNQTIRPIPLGHCLLEVHILFSCIHFRGGLLKGVRCQSGKTMLLWKRNRLKPEIGILFTYIVASSPHHHFLGLNKNWCRGFLISQGKFYH